MFDPKTFNTGRPSLPILVGGVGQGGPADEFIKEFGSMWKRTPMKGIYVLSSNRRKLCISLREDDEDMCLYEDYSLDDLKEYFRQFSQLPEGLYFSRNSKTKYPYLDILEAIKHFKV